MGFAPYSGQERLVLWMRSPNQTGVWLAMVFCVLIGLWWAGRQARLGRWRVVAWCVFAGALVTALLLGRTYSRGGYVAAFGALAAAAWLQIPWRGNLLQRLLPLAPLGLLAGLLLLVPAGGRRLRAVTDFSDLAIVHRLLVWRGGCMLIWEAPFTGSRLAPGAVYALFYQPLAKDEHYGTLLNDFLTLAARHGLPAAVLWLGLALLPVALTFSSWAATRDRLALLGGAALLAGLIGGLFSTCYGEPTLQWTFGLVALALVARWFWLRRWHGGALGNGAGCCCRPPLRSRPPESCWQWAASRITAGITG